MLHRIALRTRTESVGLGGITETRFGSELSLMQRLDLEIPWNISILESYSLSFKVLYNSINRIKEQQWRRAPVSRVSRQATNRPSLNVVRLRLNLGQHMLGRIKAI